MDSQKYRQLTDCTLYNCVTLYNLEALLTISEEQHFNLQVETVFYDLHLFHNLSAK